MFACPSLAWRAVVLQSRGASRKTSLEAAVHGSSLAQRDGRGVWTSGLWRTTQRGYRVPAYSALPLPSSWWTLGCPRLSRSFSSNSSDVTHH